MAKPATWDAKPKKLIYNGVLHEFFTRTHLAMALNRESGTIRSWELKGVVCHPLVRDKRGSWLYTREQVEALVRLAKEEGVFDPRFRNQFSQRFSEEAHRILNAEP